MGEIATLYDSKGEPVSRVEKIPNLDPSFFIPTPGGISITAEQIMDQPYRYHPWINASGRVVSTNVARLPKVIVSKKKSEEYIYDHEILESFNEPNDFMLDPETFWRAICLYLLLPSGKGFGKDNTGGQVFLIPLDKSGGKVDLYKSKSIPYLWFPFSDSFVNPVKKGLKLEGWVYEAPNHPESKMEFEVNEIIRINFFNPYSWLKGLSWFSPAAIAMTQDIQSDIYNTRFFENDARVAGVLSSDQDLTDPQYKTYTKRWYDNYGGAGKVNRIAVLGAGLKYQQYGMSQADMQFQEQKKWLKDEVIATFGINKIALGDYENINFATIREGRRMLWQDTYMPIDQKINRSINAQWINKAFPDLRLRSDYSEIEALREDYKGRAEAGKTMVQGMDFPPVLAAHINNIPLSEQNLKDYPWLREKPVKSGGMGIPPPPKQLTRQREIIKIEDDEREKVWYSYVEKVLDPGEKSYLNMLIRFFNSQRNRMQDKVDKWLDAQKSLTRVLNISPKMFLLSILEETKSLTKLSKPQVSAQMEREKKRLEQELGQLIEWDVTDARINAFVKARISTYKEINTTTFKNAGKKIGEAIKEAVQENATPQQAAKKIKAAISDVGEIRKNQSKTIARTEIGTISSSARNDAFKVEGIEYHEWLTAIDGKERDSHRAVNGSIVKVGDIFPTVNLRYPLDPSGAPEEVINCRCVTVPVLEPAE